MADEEASCGCAANTKERFSNYYRVFILLLIANSYLFESVGSSSALYQSYESDGGGVNGKSTTDTLAIEIFPKSSIQNSDYISNRRTYDESRTPDFTPKLNSVTPVSSLPLPVSPIDLHKTSLFISSSISSVEHSIISQAYPTESSTTLSTEYITSLISPSLLPSPSICISTFTISGLCKNSTLSLITSFATNSILWTTETSSLSSILSSEEGIASLTMMLQSSIVSNIDVSTYPTIMHSSSVSSKLELSTMSLQPSIHSQIELSTMSLQPSIHSQIEISSASSVTLQSAYIINPAKRVRKCEMIARNFSKALSNYTECILSNVIPMKVCFKCFNEYNVLNEHHRSIYHNCKQEFITSLNSRYQVVTQMFDFQKTSWGSLECKKCYTYRTDPPQPTKGFLQFQSMYKETMKCFRNSTNDMKNITNSGVCTDCLALYSKLQTTYKFEEDTVEVSGTKWCADINAVVNDTRHLWSGRLNCGKKDKDLQSIIALTCFFCFLPIVFYVGAKLHSDVKERKTNRYYESE